MSTEVGTRHAGWLADDVTARAPESQPDLGNQSAVIHASRDSAVAASNRLP